MHQTPPPTTTLPTAHLQDEEAAAGGRRHGPTHGPQRRRHLGQVAQVVGALGAGHVEGRQRPVGWEGGRASGAGVSVLAAWVRGSHTCGNGRTKVQEEINTPEFHAGACLRVREAPELMDTKRGSRLKLSQVLPGRAGVPLTVMLQLMLKPTDGHLEPSMERFANRWK